MENINTVIADAVVGMDASDIYAVDAAMLKVDGTKDKSNLGANAILAVSIAACRAAAASLVAAGVQNLAANFSGRRKWQPPACAHDEHSERRRTRNEYCGYTGVYDHAGGRTLF